MSIASPFVSVRGNASIDNMAILASRYQTGSMTEIYRLYKDKDMISDRYFCTSPRSIALIVFANPPAYSASRAASDPGNHHVDQSGHYLSQPASTFVGPIETGFDGKLLHLSFQVDGGMTIIAAGVSSDACCGKRPVMQSTRSAPNCGHKMHVHLKPRKPLHRGVARSRCDAAQGPALPDM